MRTNAARSERHFSRSSQDEGDFKAELLELIPFLRAFARTLCGNREEGDDLSQEALVKAWQNRHTFEPGTNLKAWLFMILRNHFYSERRRSWRQVPWEDGAPKHTPVIQAPQTPILNLEDVSRALQQLPDAQREALILVGAGGLSCEQASRICNCAVGTIKSRVARARRALVDVLENAGKEEFVARTADDDKPVESILEQVAELTRDDDKGGRG